MNNFLNNALGFVRDYAYQSMGGKEFAQAQRRNARVQRDRGLLGSYMDPKYWSQIAKGTGKAALNVLPGAALKAAGGAIRSAQAANQIRRGVTLPPTVARGPVTAGIDDMTRIAQRVDTRLNKSPYYAADDYATRSQAIEKARTSFEKTQTTKAANAARQQLQQQQRQTFTAPVTFQPGAAGRIAGYGATTAATGLAAGTTGPKPQKTVGNIIKPPKIVKAATGKKKNGRV